MPSPDTRIVFLLLAVFFVSLTSTSLKATPDRSLFDLLPDTNAPIPVQIMVNLTNLKDSRWEELEEKGVLSFHGKDGQYQQWRFKAELRGKYRRKHCDFPPLKLDFSKKDLQLRNLLPFDDLKVVTHCIDDPTGSTNVLREYLAYKLYQEVTPYSYRVRLLEIEYVDTGAGNHSFTQLGFFIEDTDAMAHRLGLEIRDTFNLPGTAVAQDNEIDHALFQYLIGNGDYKLNISRNMKIGWSAKEQKFILVPYDFDFSGLVDAEYAVPQASHQIANVRERVYLGHPHPDALMNRAFERFRSLRPAFEQVIEQASWLPRSSQRYASSYLDSFYKEIESGAIHRPTGELR